jgi:nucleoside-triphosphatase THEP1
VHKEYTEWWESENSSLLFIEGKPGSGKSTLAKYFKQKLEEKDNPGVVAHYFYTFRQTELESTHQNMLRSILRRILENDEHFFMHFQQEFRSSQPTSHREWPYDSLKKILQSCAEHTVKKQVYLIIDAMDESDKNDRRDIVALLSGLCSKKSPCVLKIFLTSRPIPPLSRPIEEHRHFILLENENGRDITKFVKDFLTPELGLTNKIRMEATEYITTQARGVFIWVSLIRKELLDYIEANEDRNQIISFLKEVPVELEDYYRFTLRRVQQPKEISNTRTIFRLVLFARRPLTVVELYHAFEFSKDSIVTLPSDEKFQENTLEIVEKRILHYGHNLLETRGLGGITFTRVFH